MLNDNVTCIEQWYAQDEAVKKMTSKLKQFVNYAKVNDDDHSIVFAVNTNAPTGASTDKLITAPAEIVVYVEGVPKIKAFEPPCYPKELKEEKITENSISLSWSPPECKLYNTEFVVSYRMKQGSKKCQSVKTKDATIVVSGLSPCTSYLFTIATNTMYGISEDSEVCEIRTTEKVTKVCSRPGQPQIINSTDESVTLTWKKPEEHADCVEYYCISYCLGINWNESNTSDNEPSITLQLQEGESYRVKVSAQCNSTVSEASDITIIKIPICFKPPGKPNAKNITHHIRMGHARA